MSDIENEIQRVIDTLHPEAKAWVQSRNAAMFIESLPVEAQEMATFIAKMAFHDGMECQARKGG
ncbi:MAG: hypothetical protein JKY94_09165 [Rhodobacteraceae bacterium]|nr:hypothetical protein [Paracoccaceae bacterium]